MRHTAQAWGNDPPVSELIPAKDAARRQWRYDAISTGTGVLLATFMWGHMLFVSTIWTGERGFNWIADAMEVTGVAQITVTVIVLAFFVHFVTASRKIPARMQERALVKRLGDGIHASDWRIPEAQRRELEKIRPHSETSLWIWQVRTGMIILALGSIHLFVVGADVVERALGRAGITAAESMGRVHGGMWLLYAALLFCVEVHGGVGLYRVVVKWGLGTRLPIVGAISRRMAHRAEQVTLWFFLGVGAVTLLILAGVIAPPLAFLVKPT